MRDRFDEIVNGIREAIDFLRNNVLTEKLDNLRYSTVLVPLATYFAVPRGAGVKLTENHRKILVRWFWRACFSRRFSAGVLRNLNRDIEEADKLRKGVSGDLAHLAATVDEDYFTEQRFNVSTVHTRTFVLLLAQQTPLSYVSGAPIVTIQPVPGPAVARGRW